MNILYCGDKNIEDGLIISIISLLKNVTENLNIYVLTINGISEIQGVTDNCINILNKKIKPKNEKNTIKKIDITEMFEKEMPLQNMKTRFTPCCMLRLFADEIPEIPDKILYLDNDVVCRKNCEEFYNQDMEEYEFAGVLDDYGKWLFKKKIFKFDYINSGVLLLNMKKIRETKLFSNARNMCKTKKMFMPDQSALNKLAKYKKIEPRKYNEQHNSQEDTVFQHFSTRLKFFPYFRAISIKPWNVEKLHEKLKIFEYDDIIIEYQKLKKSKV